MKGNEGTLITASLPSIYVAAHELKAPLVLMRQLALELQSADSQPDTQTIERLLLTVERSLRLVEQLTKTSRLEDSLFESEPLLARAICQAVSDELTPFARASRQEIVVRVSRKSGVAVGHRSLLTALLVNLCDNAIAHNPAGSKVMIAANASSSGVVFSVRDEGPKISHGMFNAMRSQLGKGPLPIGDRPRSSGLGLWIASQFAGAMGGTLTMTRHHTTGITISVELPHSKQLSLI
jgi:two-component system sensor histidine kinase KdpD